jgi:hypothetical protein
MGTSLSGQTPSQTYKDILQISNSNAGIPTALRAVSDGDGVDSALKICTTGVDINGILSISGTVLTSTASEINKLDRNSGDGYIEANKAVIAGSSRNIYFNGGDANLLGSGVYQNGNIINANLDSVSYAGYQVSATGATATGSFVIYPASGITQKLTLNQPLTQISISSSPFIAQDSSGTTGLPATYFRDYQVTLVTIQDSAGAREIDFNSSIIWPRTQWASGYSKPRLNPGYNAVASQIDVFEFRTFDYGNTWYGNYTASGVLSSSAGALPEAIIDGGSF